MVQFKTLWLEIRSIARDVATAALPGLTYIMGGYQKILDFYKDARAHGGLSREETAGLINYYLPEPLHPGPSAGGSTGALQRAVVTVTLTGDRGDATFAKRVADEVHKLTGATADQISVESPDNYVVPAGNKAGK